MRETIFFLKHLFYTFVRSGQIRSVTCDKYHVNLY